MPMRRCRAGDCHCGQTGRAPPAAGGAILADGHVLIEDVPGLAKTAIARTTSQVLGLPFKRVQCTPDLLPADLTGSFIFNQGSLAFEFRHGPIFTQFRWPTKSTVPRRRRSPRYWKRCTNIR